MGPNELGPSYQITKTDPTLQNTESGGTEWWKKVKLFMFNIICIPDWSSSFLGAEYLHLPASWEYPKQHCEEVKAEMQREKKVTLNTH